MSQTQDLLGVLSRTRRTRGTLRALVAAGGLFAASVALIVRAPSALAAPYAPAASVPAGPTTGASAPSRGAPGGLEPIARSAQTAVVLRYLVLLQNARYDGAYALLNDAARHYYRNAQNFGSVYAADGYRITRFALLGARGDGPTGRVYFARETARFRDHAHDADLIVTATVPVGVVPERGGWRIKDPGHPWRAFAVQASANANGLRVTVKKVSFFARRIEAVVSFVNAGPRFVTLLPYGKSILHDAAGRPYRLIETRDWSLTDKTLFEGLRLAPNAQYTGMLAFECEPLDDTAHIFALTLAPLLVDGADAPFAIDVDAIAAAGAVAPAPR